MSDLNAAFEAATAAFPKWSKVPAVQRGIILKKASALSNDSLSKRRVRSNQAMPSRTTMSSSTM